MRVEHSLDIDAPVARVWELTLDVESWPNHTPTMTSVERLGGLPLEVGSEVRIKQPGQRERVWTVRKLEPQSRFVWSARAMGTTMTATHELAETATGTRQTLSVELDGGLSGVIGALISRPIAKALAAENQGFKAAAEE